MTQAQEHQVVSDEAGDSRRISRAIAYASRLLSVREYSRKLIFERIIKKGFSQHEAHQTVDFMLENNWLDDLRYCEAFIRGKVSRGQGWSRISYELAQNGIDSSTSLTICEQLDICWQTICDQVTEKKLKLLQVKNDLNGRHKVERFLRYRGFSSTEIRQSIKKYLSNSGVTTGEYDEQ